VSGFIWSKSLPPRVSMDLMHVQDWMPTLYEAAGMVFQRSALIPEQNKIKFFRWTSIGHA